MTSLGHANVSTFTVVEGKTCEPIIELPMSPELESTKLVDFERRHDEDEVDIEDILSINLCSQQSPDIPKVLGHSFEEYDHDISSSIALVTLYPHDAHILLPKIKSVNHLRTERTM